MQIKYRILVEGLDNSGKSTLIDSIVKHYKKPFMKLHFYGPPFKTTEENIDFDIELYRGMVRILNDFNYVIADRSHLGAMVYSPMYRDNDGKYVLRLEKDLPDDTILITLIDKAENLIKRDDGLSFTTDIDKKNQEIELFKKAHEQSGIKRKLLLDIDGLSIDEVFQKAISFIEGK